MNEKIKLICYSVLEITDFNLKILVQIYIALNVLFCIRLTQFYNKEKRKTQFTLMKFEPSRFFIVGTFNFYALWTTLLSVAAFANVCLLNLFTNFNQYKSVISTRACKNAFQYKVLTNYWWACYTKTW